MNNTERFIAKIYNSVNIRHPGDLSVEYISERFLIKLNYWEFSSTMVEFKNKYKVFINQNLNHREQWQDFGHEMSHYFKDRGDRFVLRESFIDYCESKADYFAYHFCVPTFMLMKLKGVDVYEVMRLFNVEFDFALKRLEMYKNKLLVKPELQFTNY